MLSKINKSKFLTNLHLSSTLFGVGSSCDDNYLFTAFHDTCSLPWQHTIHSGHDLTKAFVPCLSAVHPPTGNCQPTGNCHSRQWVLFNLSQTNVFFFCPTQLKSDMKLWLLKRSGRCYLSLNVLGCRS